MQPLSPSPAAREANVDGLVGLTHNYAGLSFGNVASATHGGAVSRPRDAALQGLGKMRTLVELGHWQALLPPHERPHLPTLRALGFTGTDADVVARVGRDAPALLAMTSSASAMWTANAATVAPSADTADGRVHLSTANLVHKAHRALEGAQTHRALRALFPNTAQVAVHAPLPAHDAFGDEGAANHTRLASRHGQPGVHLFVYGRDAAAPMARPTRYPARQTRLASEAIARRHGVRASVFAQQHPDAIDAGVFHNDVIAVGHLTTLLYHERAFIDAEATLAALRACLPDLNPICVREAEVSIDDAIASYLFNAQLVGDDPDDLTLIAPIECAETPSVARAIAGWVDDPSCPIQRVLTLDLRESMRNGGGPACLRLRVPLTHDEWAGVHHGCRLDEARIASLEAWVSRHYRDTLTNDELRDPALLLENRAALDALTQLLELGSIYDFQRAGATVVPGSVAWLG